MKCKEEDSGACGQLGPLSPLAPEEEINYLSTTEIIEMLEQGQSAAALQGHDAYCAVVTNFNSAANAATAVSAHVVACRLDGTVPQVNDYLTAVRDLINDLHHLTDALGLDWDEASRLYHYNDETGTE